MIIVVLCSSSLRTIVLWSLRFILRRHTRLLWKKEEEVVDDVDCDEAAEVQGANVFHFVDPSRNLETIDRTQNPN